MLEPDYRIGDQSVFLTPRQIGGYLGAAAEVVGGGSLQSEDFVSGGTTGWIIRGDGSFELAGGEFRGDIESSNFVADTSGWHFDWDTGDGEFNGTLTARDVVTGPSGDSRVVLTDASGGLGSTDAAVFWDTGLVDQDTGGYIASLVVGGSTDALLMETGDGLLLETGDALLLEGASRQAWLAMVAPQMFGSGYSPPSISMASRSADDLLEQQFIVTIATSGQVTPGGIYLTEDQALYYGQVYSSNQTYMLLSSRVDFWNWEWVRVNTGTNLIVDDYLGSDTLVYRTIRLTGTLDGSGNVTVNHGITNGHRRGLIAQGWYKGGSGEMKQLTMNRIDSTQILMTGGTASATYRLVITYTDANDEHAW